MRMTQGRQYTQQEYKQYASLFKEAWLDGHPEVQVALLEAGEGAAAQARVLEAEYWWAFHQHRMHWTLASSGSSILH